jgi:hypothetical protein
VEALKKTKQTNPIGRWFIKADATDMQMGLRESMQCKWTIWRTAKSKEKI